MVTEYIEADAKFTQQTHSPFAIKSHLDMYNEMQLKVAELLDLLSESKLRESDFSKPTCRSNNNDRDDQPIINQ